MQSVAIHLNMLLVLMDFDSIVYVMFLGFIILLFQSYRFRVKSMNPFVIRKLYRTHDTGSYPSHGRWSKL